jgi:type IV pilus assembly protein PilE
MKERGFTLIELLIVVCAIGILAAIGFPAYTEYVQRGKVVEALGQLATTRVRLEQYYQDNRKYGTTASSCPPGVDLPQSAHFTFTCTWGADSTPQTFLLTATGTAASGMAGFVFTVDETNRQVTKMYAGAERNLNCWMKRKGDACS